MKRLSLLMATLLMLCATAASAAAIKAPGTSDIRIGDYFKTAVEAKGLKAPVKFSVAKGRLPFGLRLHANGKIDGYPAAIMRTSATIKAAGADNKSASAEIKFVVTAPAFRLIYQEIPPVKIGQSASVKIEGQGGKAPYSGCAIDRARSFYNGGAAKPGAKAPMDDMAPAWLKLSSDCKLTATKPDKETTVLMVISARDAAGATASEFFALRATANPASPGWLEQKAREYNNDYQKRFSPNGLTLEINPQGIYHAYGDSAIWSGTYLAGAAYYYAVTGEKSAYQNMKRALDATTKLREITGVPGLIARAFEGEENTGRGYEPDIKDAPERNSYLIKDGKYKGWRFLSTASRDQFTGVFWGNATVWELNDDPALRKQASENIVSMSAHIWDNDMHIMDADGKHTKHGVMSGYGIQDSDGVKNYDPYTSPARIPNGFNGALILNWFNMAATVAPDSATQKLWRDRYLALISKEPNPAPGRSFERDYLAHLKKVYVYGEKYNTYWETVWFNMNLLFNNYFHLTRFETDPATREVYRGILRWLWTDKKQMNDGCEFPEKRRAGRERNPHFTWQYLAAQGDREPDKIFNAVSELMIFPRGPRAPFRVVDPYEIKAVPDHPGWACEPIPIQYRMTEDFMWQRDPYSIKQPWPESHAGRNFAGVDVITPYWMGRYFGYIPGNI